MYETAGMYLLEMFVYIASGLVCWNLLSFLHAFGSCVYVPVDICFLSTRLVF